MLTQFLSEGERSKGRHYFSLYELFNGVSIGFLGDTLVFILAIGYGASNFVLSYITAALYMTALIVPLSIPFLNGKNVRKIQSTCWYFRGVSSVLYVLLLVLPNYFSVYVVVATYTLYCVFRAVGMICYDTVAKSITNISNRGAFYAHISVYYNLFTLISKVFASLFLSFSPFTRLHSIIFLMSLGIIGNTVASFCISRVPCRLTFTYTKETSILQTLKNTYKNKKHFTAVVLRWISLFAQILVGMGTPFMSKVLNLSDSMTIVYSSIVILALITAALFVEKISDVVGAYPIIRVGSLFSMIFCVIWAAMAKEFSFIPFFVLGFFINFCFQCVYLVSTKLTADAIPDKNGTSFTLLVNVGIGVSAICAGILGGFLVNLGSLEIFNIAYFTNDYFFCFLVAGIIAIVIFFLSKEIKSTKATDSSISILSPSLLNTISKIKHLENNKSPIIRRRTMMDLSLSNTKIAEEEIRRKLLSPYSRDVDDVILNLSIKPNYNLVSDLINIAIDDDSFNQVSAIKALGSYISSKEAENALVYIMRESKWKTSKSCSSSSLSHFKNSYQYLSEIENERKKSVHIDELMNYIVAEFYSDSEKKVLWTIFDYVESGKSVTFKETFYSFMDTLSSDETPRLSRLYGFIKQGRKVDEVIYNYLYDLQSIYSIKENIDNITKAYKDENKSDIIKYSYELYKNEEVKDIPISLKNTYDALKKGVEKAKSIDADRFDIVDLVALTYFSSLIASPGTFVFPYQQNKKI